MNPLRLFSKYSIMDPVATLQENKKYFCSELIGTLYKVMGILPKDISSATYWPGSFSSETKLQLLSGGVLSDEYLIEFKD